MGHCVWRACFGKKWQAESFNVFLLTRVLIERVKQRYRCREFYRLAIVVRVAIILGVAFGLILRLPFGLKPIIGVELFIFYLRPDFIHRGLEESIQVGLHCMEHTLGHDLALVLV